jgi:alanine-glyoxylate transaminase / serine-glyoxylate transaminase / serine-pyruvate transaminase
MTKPLNPTTRQLLGPGPTNVTDGVLAAMQKPMLGHLDPEFHEIVSQVAGMLAAVYQRRHGLTLALSATGTGGLETGLAALVRPTEKIIVGTAGFFGDRLVELSRRRGAQVVEVRADPGEHIETEAFLDAVERHGDAVLVAVVHADTSTGVRQPVDELARALAGADQLLLVDCVTSLGGIELDADQWGLDYCFSCSQKCIGAPPGLSPISVSERALARMRAGGAQVPFYFDLELLAGYWAQRLPAYHHTLPVLSIYALHAALANVLEEGLSARWRRHRLAGNHLQSELRRRGFELLAEPEYQLPQLTAVRVPDGIDGRAVQRRLIEKHGIEIGGPLSKAGPDIWRIGLMGVNASIESAERALGGLEDVLAEYGMAPAGSAVVA